MSSAFTCSASTSIEIYQEKLKPCIDILGKSDVPLQHLVREAEQIVKDSFAPDSRSTYSFRNGYDDEVSAQLDQVMLAMLSHAEESGGERGQRYVASAIVACSKQDDMVGALEALGTTWLTHLLFLFKIGDEEHLEGKSDVMSRDGYTCVLTGFQDLSHPQPDRAKSPFAFKLKVSHILRRAIGNLSRNSRFFKSPEVTVDILVNLTHLSRDVLEELGSDLDDPSNEIILEANAHNAFDRFHWCMKKTEKENEYAVKAFNEYSLFRFPENNRISFEDHGDDFSSDSTRTTQRPVPLPDPRYIALHSAIAEIMNTSNAGTFFDQLFKRYADNRRRISACQTWSEFESLVEDEMVRESVRNMFHLANVQ